jgi:predicted metal-dependent HD superfamily phosphohydrolase
MAKAVTTLAIFDLPQYLREALPRISREQIQEILDAYQEHWRTYHNLGHIMGMIKSAEVHFRSQCEPDEWRALLAMIGGHDVVLKVGLLAANNETASADFTADIVVKTGEPKWFETCVWKGIVATQKHSLKDVPDHHHQLVSYLLDLDLEGLGMSAVEFAANTEAIWLEFQPVTTREKYNDGRGAWARSFLARPRIFHTELFYARYEQRARENLGRLIQR